MKPKDLKMPYTFDERCVFLENGWMGIPSYYSKYEEFSFPGWDVVFPKSQPIHIEYCSGNGRWIAEMAKRHPDKNWVAVEKRFDRVRKIWAKQQNEGIDNLFIVWGAAELFTKYYVPTASVQGVYINFPDPWPKDRHAKHRIVQTPFISLVEERLTDDGTVQLVTDDPDFMGQMVEVMQASELESSYPKPYYITDHPDYGSSWFEDLWREKGRTIHYLRYGRLPCLAQ